MRPAGRWTTLRYRLRRVAGRIGCGWASALAAGEELAILTGLRPRHIPPKRLAPRKERAP